MAEEVFSSRWLSQQRAAKENNILVFQEVEDFLNY
jgi:hypothetical protein